MLIKTTELRQLDVISVDEGRFLGRVCRRRPDPGTGKSAPDCGTARE